VTRALLALCLTLARDPRPGALDRLSRRPVAWIVRRVRAVGRDGRR